MIQSINSYNGKASERYGHSRNDRPTQYYNKYEHETVVFFTKKTHQNVQHHEQLITMNDSHLICMNRKFLVKRSMVLIFMTRKLFIQIIFIVGLQIAFDSFSITFVLILYHQR
jgi:hypothetical protein